MVFRHFPEFCCRYEELLKQSFSASTGWHNYTKHQWNFFHTALILAHSFQRGNPTLGRKRCRHHVATKLAPAAGPQAAPGRPRQGPKCWVGLPPRPCATAEEGDRQMAGDSWRGRETGLLAAWRVEAGGQRGGVQGKQKVGGGWQTR